MRPAIRIMTAHVLLDMAEEIVNLTSVNLSMVPTHA